MKKLLFITWDGPQTSYLESLFMPIFSEVSKKMKLEFHVLQLTWASQEKISKTRKTAEKLGIQFQTIPIYRKPFAALGSLLTLKIGAQKIRKYIQQNNIDIVMPRSTLPAMMLNQINLSSIAGFRRKLIFDADGLPLEERTDFSGLSKESYQYKKQKSQEIQMLEKADVVITRSQKAVDIHVQNIGEKFRSKFFVVSNGKNAEHFNINSDFRKHARTELEIPENSTLFVYAGSLGNHYCLQEMFSIFAKYSEKQHSRFLILTGNLEFAQENIPEYLKSNLILKNVEPEKVPFYLNAADVAFALRKPSFSMQGVAPIKLGEYLLCGIPTIASKGIGDTEEILQHFQDCFLLDHSKNFDLELNEILNFIENSKFANKRIIREKAVGYFSLEAAAKSYIKALKELA